uniref:Divalent Anion:Na+ symporter family n=1 Tax=Micromonas pusilla TaxID=38833 RepID=A0A6U2B0Y4_MICPS|mmetsp:Transcript_11113/g.43319  ORF Transcript_11113/g.43319 Transcript_11113/m.43319 type:complete len:1417 (+) Transcript_11113:272-4522(+)
MAEVWEGWFTVGIVFVAFGCLLWDVIQPDHVMIGAVAVLMAAGVVSVEEGLAGFANEGLLTVAVLFVVAAGISATGGLDWYMSKLLGHPTTIAGAQLRLMIPIAVVSAFLNNTPVVAVMIPIVQRWAENIHIPKEQVMIPLSFASILGGTCTLIGTSTNLVVLGMLKDWKGSDGSSETKQSMGLFDLGLFGVPVAMTGLTYMLIASRALLPGGKKKGEAGAGGGGGGAGGGGGKSEDLIVGARLQAWSAAVGKTVAGSGLRGLPGLYLVSVKREDTLIRAVGPEFVLSQGDVLYFTGMVESIGNVCAEYGLLAVTTEHDSDSEGGSDEDGSDGDENDGSPPAGRVSPEDTGRGGAEGAEGADESAVAPMELGSTTETESDGSATKVQTTKARAANVGIPPSVPETSALMEIQMLARSQAIGGVAGEWQSAGQQGGKSSKSQASGGKPKGRALSSGGETSATSAGSASESEGGGGWSSGGELGLGRRSAGDGGETSEGNAASGPDGASSDAATGLRRRRRRGSSNVRSGQSPVGPDGWPDDDEVRDMASGVALDPGERRSLRMYQSSHSRGHRGRRSVDGRSARHGRRRRDSESAAVSRAAAEKALGPPKVTVELDPEDPTAGRMVLGISAPDRPGLLHDISQGLNRLQVQLLHCEASVVAGRSVSIWRLQVIKKETTREEISTVIDALLAPATGADAAKKKGVSVLRARVRFRSALVGKTAGEANFQTAFGAAIIGMLRGGRRPPGKLGQVRFAADDILVLQCEESSPLLAPPPEDLQSAVDALARVPSQGSFLTLRDVPQTPHSDDANPSGANANGILKSPGSSRFFRKKSAGGGMEEMDAATRTTTEAEPRDSQTQTHGGAEHKAEAGVSSGEVAVAIPETHEASDAAGASSDDFAGRVRAAHVALEVTGAKEESREFLIAVRIKAGAREFIKKTAEDAGLRSLPGLFLVSVERPRKASGVSGGGGANAKESSSPRAQTTPATVAPPAEMVSSVALVVNAEDEKGSKVDSEGVDVVDPAVDPLQADDVLWYAGTAASIAMIRKIPGLAPYATDQVDKLNANSQERRLIQAVVAKTGPLVGKSIRDIKFRSRYNAVVLAVHREGVRVHARIGDVVLHPGDVLLLDAGPDFHREAGHSGSGFALVSVLEDSAPPRLRLLVPVLVIAVAMIVFYTAGVTELIIAAIFAAGIMIACGALSEQEARDAIKWDVIVTIAAAFGMSKALQNSGVAGFVAEKLVRLAELSGTGRGGLLVAVYLATFVISNVVTNNAAAALMFPVAAEAAERQGESLASMSFLVMLAASASFMSPFGYQTNLMVYGPGGYVFKDFLRFGVPMQVVQMVVSVVVIVLGDRFWYVSWGATGLGFAATCVLMTTTPENALNDFIGFFRRLLGKTTAGADEDEDEDEGRRRRSRRAR